MLGFWRMRRAIRGDFYLLDQFKTVIPWSPCLDLAPIQGTFLDAIREIRFVKIVPYYTLIKRISVGNLGNIIVSLKIMFNLDYCIFFKNLDI